jgi:two-component system OmpR family response regulator
MAQWNGPRPRVLVVDDDPSIVELITTRLELAGYQTAYARDGYEGMARLQEFRPGALVLDINMPRLDGFGMLRQMKQAGLTGRVATMVLTARNQPEDVQQAVALGARDYLSKPFDDQRLLTRVARLFQKARPRPASPPGDDAVLL